MDFYMSDETTFVLKLPITSTNSAFMYSFTMTYLNVISQTIKESKCLVTTWLSTRKLWHVSFDVTPYLGLEQKMLATMFALKWIRVIVNHVLTIKLPVKLMCQ